MFRGFYATLEYSSFLSLTEKSATSARSSLQGFRCQSSIYGHDHKARRISLNPLEQKSRRNYRLIRDQIEGPIARRSMKKCKNRDPKHRARNKNQERSEPHREVGGTRMMYKARVGAKNEGERRAG